MARRLRMRMRNHWEEAQAMRLSERLSVLMERQKDDPQVGGWTGEKSAPGRFKVSAEIIRMMEKDAPAEWRDEMGRVDLAQMLFTEQQKLLKAIPREDLPALLGADNIPDAQDVLARDPREAFKLMLRNIAKVSPKAARLMRAVPVNVSIYWYLIMARLSGRDMADDLFKKYFSTAQGGKAFAQARKKFEAVGEDEDEGEEEEAAMDDDGVCPVTGAPRACEARDASEGAACEGCEGPEDEDDEDEDDEEGMDAEEASEAVGHWVRALVEAAKKKKKPSKGQQLSAKYINPKTGAFKGRKGEKFQNCVKYMKAKGSVSDPKALCGAIARKKAGAMAEAGDRDRMNQASLQQAAKAALRPATLLLQMLPPLVERRNEMTLPLGQDLYRAAREMDRLHAALTALAAGHAMREDKGAKS